MCTQVDQQRRGRLVITRLIGIARSFINELFQLDAAPFARGTLVHGTTLTGTQYITAWLTTHFHEQQPKEAVSYTHLTLPTICSV
eukprot:12032597-Prorocentrum_lima.AAC.1